MKKISILCLLGLCTLVLCAALIAYPPRTQTEAVTVALSEIEFLPTSLDGSFSCTVTYTPRGELSAVIRNDTQFDLSHGERDGKLYRCGNDGGWTEIYPASSTFKPLVTITYPPGGEDTFSVAGLEAPELDPGDYRLVFPVSLNGDALEEALHFNLIVPFSVE